MFEASMPERLTFLSRSCVSNLHTYVLQDHGWQGIPLEAVVVGENLQDPLPPRLAGL